MPSDRGLPRTAEASQRNGLNPTMRIIMMRIIMPFAVLHATVNLTLKPPLVGSTIPDNAVPALRTVGDIAMYGLILGSFAGCWIVGVACIQWIRARSARLSG